MHKLYIKVKVRKTKKKNFSQESTYGTKRHLEVKKNPQVSLPRHDRRILSDDSYKAPVYLLCFSRPSFLHFIALNSVICIVWASRSGVIARHLKLTRFFFSFWKEHETYTITCVFFKSVYDCDDVNRCKKFFRPFLFFFV